MRPTLTRLPAPPTRPATSCWLAPCKCALRATSPEDEISEVDRALADIETWDRDSEGVKGPAMARAVVLAAEVRRLRRVLDFAAQYASDEDEE